MLGCEASPNTFKRIEALQNIFSDHCRIKLKINRMKSGKCTNIWKLNDTLLSKPWVKEIVRVQKCFEPSENKITYQCLWDTAKALQAKFMALNAYNGKEEGPHITYLSFHLHTLEKQEQTKSKASRRMKIIKMKVEISEIESRKIIQKIKLKPDSSETSTKLTKVWPDLPRKREETQIIKIRNERGHKHQLCRNQKNYNKVMLLTTLLAN